MEFVAGVFEKLESVVCGLKRIAIFTNHLGSLCWYEERVWLREEQQHAIAEQA